MKRTNEPEECYFCTDSIAFDSRSVAEAYETQMITLPVKGKLCDLHLQIIPYDHVGAYADADQDVKDELAKVKRDITEKFNKIKKVPIFSEITVQKHHTFIDVFPIDGSVAKTAKKYFINAINNKLPDGRENKIIELKNIPKVSSKVKYLYVEIMGEGIMQIIDSNEIDVTFIKSIVAGLMGLGKERVYECKHSTSNLTKDSQLFDSFWNGKETKITKGGE